MLACVLRWLLATGLVVVFVLLDASVSVRADHVVRVRAETRIELDVTRMGPTVSIRGALRDDAGAPVADRDLQISVRPERGPVIVSRTLRTDERGTFTLEVGSLPGACVVDAAFLGEPDLEASSVRLVSDEERTHVVLVVALPDGNRLSLDAPSHRVRLRASSARGGADLDVSLHNETGTELGSGRTDASGDLVLEIASSLLGPPAAGRLIARSQPDPRRAGAQTEVPIVRYRETTLAWRDESTHLEEDTILRLRLSTATGPLERRAVGVFVGGVHVATRLTGPDGDLAIRIAPELAGTSTSVEVAARFDADAPWLASSQAPPRTLAVESSPRLVPWLAIGSGVVFLLASLWLRRRPLGDAPAPVQSRAPGVTAGRPVQILPTLREVTGVIVHAATGDPIAGASVRCGSAETISATDGSFALAPADGVMTLTAEAPAFETIQQRLAIPHRGEWIRATIRLESRRDLASRVLLEILAISLPGEVASTATDRELLAIARARRGTSAELDALVSEVEEIVYGEAPPSASSLERVMRLARAARQTLARVDSASPGSL